VQELLPPTKQALEEPPLLEPPVTVDFPELLLELPEIEKLEPLELPETVEPLPLELGLDEADEEPELALVLVRPVLLDRLEPLEVEAFDVEPPLEVRQTPSWQMAPTGQSAPVAQAPVGSDGGQQAPSPASSSAAIGVPGSKPRRMPTFQHNRGAPASRTRFCRLNRRSSP
jgi:hypothetical protein